MNKSFVVVLGMAALLSTSASAQQVAPMSTTITIGTVLYINVATTAITFAAPTETDFNAGFINASNSSLVGYAGNVRHSVVIWSAAAAMTGSAGTSLTDVVNPTKAVADFKWSTDNYVTTPGVIASSTSATGGKVVTQAARGDHRAPGTTVKYRMALSYATDTPGTYALNFNYTVIAD
jgi:hypothetical protein